MKTLFSQDLDVLARDNGGTHAFTAVEHHDHPMASTDVRYVASSGEIEFCCRDCGQLVAKVAVAPKISLTTKPS